MRRAILAALTLLIVACATSEPVSEETSPDPEGSTIPEGPPWGLDTIDQPNTAEAVGDVLDGMPLNVDGIEKTTVGDRTEVVWEGDGRTLQIRALPLSDLREFSGSDDLTVAGYIETLAESGELETIESQDLDDTLTVLAATGRGDGVLLYTAAWGDPDGDWLFSVTADTPEARAELVRAFVQIGRESAEPAGEDDDV